MIAALVLLAAGGFPDGAPWDHAGAPQTDTCAGCHWDRAPEAASERLAIDGLPQRVEPGARYALTVRLAGAGAANGFQLVASAGRFETDHAGVEVRGAAARSRTTGGAWRLAWTADETTGPVTFWLAVTDANDDASPFGDRVLLRTFESLP